VTAIPTDNGAPSASISAEAVVYAPPELVEAKPSSAPSDAKPTQGWGKKVKPPSMVLDDDVNGFQAKNRGGDKRGGGSKKKGKKVRIIQTLHHYTN
jgi:splicing factor 45